MLPCVYTHFTIIVHASLHCVMTKHVVSVGAPQDNSIITSSSEDKASSMSLSLTPTNTDTSNESTLTGPDLPTAIIIAAAILGGTFLLLIVFIACALVFFTRKKRKYQQGLEFVNRRRNSNFSDMQATGFANPTDPNYSPINKQSPVNGCKPSLPPLKPPIAAVATVPLHYAAKKLPEPREILAYHDVDLLEKFRPLPPPPPSLAADYGGLNTKLYDVPEAMYDEDGKMVHVCNGNQLHRKTTRNPYDDAEAMPTANIPKRGMRSQSVRTFGSHDYDRERNSNMVPSFQRTSSLKSPSQNGQFDQIYQEQLEPSMLYNVQSLDQSSNALPYGPIYDVPKPLKNTDDVLHVMPESVIEIRDLGMGRFGTVCLAATVGLSFKDIRLGENDDKHRSLLVAIKKLSPEGGNVLREAFEKEIKYMAHLHHPNVVRLLGVCMVGIPFIMMEYMENGDLNEFLQKQMLVDDSVNLLQENQISPLVLLYMTVQIASGMRYLASQRVVHRDIATRNCLVGRDFVVKISDFGMSRKLYESFYYRVHGKLILPIRWMAYESFYGKFSVKSDVWAFGITMWEIYSLARYEPYHEFSDEKLIADAMKGEGRQRPARPAIVPNSIYDVMLRCWVHDPFMRGDFEEVYSRLFLAYTRMCQQCH